MKVILKHLKQHEQTVRGRERDYGQTQANESTNDIQMREALSLSCQ